MKKQKKQNNFGWIFKPVRIVLGCVVLSTLSPTDGYSQSDLTLKDCLNYALDKSNDVASAALDRQMAGYKTKEVRSSGLPQINGVGSFETYPSIPTQILPGEIIGQPGTQVPVQFGTKYNVSGGFELNQMVYNHQFFTGLKAAKSSAELYEIMEIKSKEDVIYNVSMSFFQVLQMQEQMKNLETNLEKLNKLEVIMKSQMENDLINKVDYTRVKVNMTNLETQLKNFKSGIEQQKLNLVLLMGMPMDATISITKEAELESSSTVTSATFNLDARTDIQLLNKQMELTLLERKSFKAGYYPTLNAFGRYSYAAQRNEFNFFNGSEKWFNTAIIGLQLNVPIFDGLKKRSQVQQNQISTRKLELDILNSKRFIQMEYTNANTQLVNSLESIESQKRNVELAEEVYKQTQELYKESVATLSDLLDAESTLREAKSGYNTEVLKLKIAELDLLKSRGELTSLTK